MAKPTTSTHEIKQIKQLRRRGYSLPEIAIKLKRSKSTVHRYAKDVKVSPKFADILKSKQGGSKRRSHEHWSRAKEKAKILIPKVEEKDMLIALACLYWAEGSKGELSFINGDPDMLRFFVKCLVSLGVKRSEITLSLRIYEDIDAREAKKFWSEALEIPVQQILYATVLTGKKSGKLKYGMCRLRVIKSGEYFKLIMSMIDLLRHTHVSCRSSMDRTRVS